jgi:hypothetical protein
MLALSGTRYCQPRNGAERFAHCAHALWVDARDTPADIEAKRDRLIAAGRARPDDTFVYVRWKRRDGA